MDDGRDGPDPRLQTRVVVRPIASPFALGFFGLAGATIVAASVELGWTPGVERTQAGLVIVIFGPLQLLASIFGFLARDAVAATGMGILGATWGVIGAVLIASPPGASSIPLGAFLVVTAAAVSLSAFTAGMSKIVPALVLATAGIRFSLTAAYELSGNHTATVAAGWCGVALAVLASYAAIAVELESLDYRGLPVIHRRSGEEAMHGSFAEQLADVQHEPGVRKQL